MDWKVVPPSEIAPEPGCWCRTVADLFAHSTLDPPR